MVKFDNLTAIEYSEPELMDDYGYKYTVGFLRSGMCQAYRTKSGFENFMKVYNLKIDYIEEQNWKMTNKKIKIYHFKSLEIDEQYFWNIEDVKDMNPFIGLCNGSYVVCYYKHYKNRVKIMRPNPNAKNVYTELDYKEMAKIWG